MINLTFLLFLIFLFRTFASTTTNFLLDQQASRYIQSRLKSSNAIQRMQSILTTAEKKYTGNDSQRYLNCMEYYIHTAVFLETTPCLSLQLALQKEVDAAMLLYKWSKLQNNQDRLNILIEYQRHYKPIDTTDNIQRVGSQLYAPEGRIYKLDLLIGQYIDGRKEALVALDQAKSLLVFANNHHRESTQFYIDVMNKIEDLGLEFVFELHQYLQDKIEQNSQTKTEKPVKPVKIKDTKELITDNNNNNNNNNNKNNKKNRLSLALIRPQLSLSIVLTFMSVPQWSHYKDTSDLANKLSIPRFEPEPWSSLWWSRLKSYDPLVISLSIGSLSFIFFTFKWLLIIKRWKQKRATKGASMILFGIVCIAMVWRYRKYI